ncbi:hypothetical protein PTTG_03106 [Puccinia triticina 1-1 BBBD Race 1]|uniref:Secreted protein n=1 Tax=Puccinia triticina (isolate 1-1 / race 1 (BBBD)) TaxID=630390 RepID=A0A0C4EQP5_PUCT1|nr:hypothetical protein PTTG_03106 [Puccinia triticina 1-1 BBBD Race 1]
MILPSVITLAIGLFLGHTPSFTYASSLEARQGPVDFQALKSAPLARRNLPGLDINSDLGSGRIQHEHGSPNNFPNPHRGSSSYGQDSYDPSKGGYDSGKAIYPSGNNNHGLGTGIFDLGTGTHHALQEGTLDYGNGGYTGSDPGFDISPKPKTSGNDSDKKSYDSEPKKVDSITEHKDYTSPSKSYGSDKGSTGSYQDPYSTSSEDFGKKYDSEVKDRGEYAQSPGKDNSKSTSGTDYSKQDNSKYNGEYTSPNGKKKSGYDGTAKNPDQSGSFIFEPGTTEEQRKAAQKESDTDGAL